MKDVCVVLPTYNEAGTIRELLAALERSMVGLSIRVVVVDDGSKDGTLGILREMMERHGNIILVERGRKLGLGIAIIDGFKTALSLEPEPEFVVTMDADLSHDPGELPSLVEACDGDTVVIGSRYVENGEIHGWGPYRKMVSAVANFFVRAFTDINARDCTSGFRCYSASLVRAVLPNLESVGYDVQIETLHEAVRLGFSIEERPITFRERRSGESKLKFGDIWGFMKRVYTLFRRSGEWRRIIKFGIVGLIGAFVNEGLLWYLTSQVGIYYMVSAVISTEAAIINNFFWNEVWTFREHAEDSLRGSFSRFMKFNLSRIVGMAMGVALMVFFTEMIGVYYLISNIIAVGIVFTWNYLTSAAWVW